MKAEIIAVGSELLLGDVVNTNATWISKELAALGIDVFFHVTVGDNPTRIKSILEAAISRSDVLIFTGGLGPTDDDLTVATLAEFFNTPMEVDPVSQARIKKYFIAKDQLMSPKNLKQALRPVDALAIENPVGTAPGLYWDVSEKTGRPTVILSFPGVPKELYAMWEEGRQRLIEKRNAMGASKDVLVTRFLYFFGIGESKIGEILGDLMAQESPTVAPYVGKTEVKIRIAVKAASEEEGLKQIEPVKREAISRLSDYYFGEGTSDDASMERSVANLLFEKGLTVAVAESCTGGLLSSRLTDVPDSSRYTFLNTVTYSNEQKMKTLGVQPQTIETHGAVSPETAGEMARGIRKLSGCDLGISLTGIAGPTGGTDEKPVGLVYIGLDAAGLAEPIVKKVMVNPNYGRVDTKYWFTQYALNTLRLYVMGKIS